MTKITQFIPTSDSTQTYRVFVGISRKHYTVVIENNGHFLALPSSYVDKSKKDKDLFVSLDALERVLKILNKHINQPYNLIYYCNNFDIKYEWENEINKTLKPQLTYNEKWMSILKKVMEKRVRLQIKNDESSLIAIGKIYE